MGVNKKPFLRRLKTSLAGLMFAVTTEANMRIHLAVAISVVTAGILFRIERLEWLAVVIGIGGVIAAECFNTAIERLADRVQPDLDPLIGQAKDCAAGAVLCTAIAAAVVGSIVFWPRVGVLFEVWML